MKVEVILSTSWKTSEFLHVIIAHARGPFAKAKTVLVNRELRLKTVTFVSAIN